MFDGTNRQLGLLLVPFHAFDYGCLYDAFLSSNTRGYRRYTKLNITKQYILILPINGSVYVSSEYWCVSRRETRGRYFDPCNTGYWSSHPQTGELLWKIPFDVHHSYITCKRRV